MADSGNARVHKCIYHGWAFRPDGSFIGAPIEKEQMHGIIKSKAQLGLKKARVQLYGGLVFATWDHEGPSLEDWLGDMKFYYDMLFDRTEKGLEVLGPPQRISIDANWKTAGEQSACDGFHTLTLHGSVIDIGAMGGEHDTEHESAPAMYGINLSGNGHSLRCIAADTSWALAHGKGDLTPEEHRGEDGVLVREVVVQRALSHADRLRDEPRAVTLLPQPQDRATRLVVEHGSPPPATT